MDFEVNVQHGMCKNCGRETLVLSRMPDEDNYELESSTFCPYCGNSALFSTKENFGDASYNLNPDILKSFSELIGLETCESCGCPLVLSLDNREILKLTFYMEKGPISGYSYEYLSFCKDCLENKPQRELIEICTYSLAGRTPSVCFNGESPDYSFDSVREAFKRREII